MADALVAKMVSVELGGRQVVRNVSLRAEHGAVLALIGPNGAGKSSLLKALAGLVPCSGSVEVEGVEVSSLEPRARARAIAYVPQQTSLRAHLSVREVVLQGRFAHQPFRLRPPPAQEPIVERALRATGVAALAARSFVHLSGGEQRRVLLARAIATEARVLLLDEPTAGLDVSHALTFHALVRDLARSGCSVIFVMHDLGEVRRHADRALLMHQGQAVTEGPSGDVLSAAPIERVYGVEMEENAAPRFHLTRPTT
jgi:iron complex transport system ATP-binding protein